MAICPSGHATKEGAKFCGTCGVEIVSSVTAGCPAGHDNRPGAKFCRTCGSSLSVTVPARGATGPLTVSLSGSMATSSPTEPTKPASVPRAPTAASPANRPQPAGAPRTSSSEFRAFAGEVLPPEEQVARNLVVLLVDNSGSMSEDGSVAGVSRLTELNEALEQFVSTEMHSVPQLEVNGELAIGVFAYDSLEWMTLEGKPTSAGSPFRYARNLHNVPKLEPTSGLTPMNKAITSGLAAIEERKRSLAHAGYVHESRPVMFLITDGVSSFVMDEALAALRLAEREKHVLFFALGVGNADDEAMTEVAPLSYYSLKSQPIRDCLTFVSGSLSVLNGLDDTADSMYTTIRSANSRGNATAEEFLDGL